MPFMQTLGNILPNAPFGGGLGSTRIGQAIGRGYGNYANWMDTLGFENAASGARGLSEAIPNKRLDYLGRRTGLDASGNPEYVAPTGTNQATTDGATTNATAGVTEATSDPYSLWGGQTNYDNLLSGITSGLSGIHSTANTSIGNSKNKLNQGIMGFIENLRTGQQGIDEQGVQNEYSRKQGRSGILNMVGRGIQSGNVMLAGRNAADSSAAGAIARAYGDLGQAQGTQVNQDYALNQRSIGQQQEGFNNQRELGVNQLTGSKDEAVTGIVASAQQELAALEAQRLQASLPEQFQIEVEKEAIRQRALQALDSLIPGLQSGAQGIQAMTPEQQRIQAEQLATQGTAPQTAYNFAPVSPVSSQQTASELPFYTRPRDEERV